MSLLAVVNGIVVVVVVVDPVPVGMLIGVRVVPLLVTSHALDVVVIGVVGVVGVMVEPSGMVVVVVPLPSLPLLGLPSPPVTKVPITNRQFK